MKISALGNVTRLQSALILIVALLGLRPAPAQTLHIEGDALLDRAYNTDNGPTNSQLTLDFPIIQAGFLQDILTWGENDGLGGINGVGQSFELYVLRPLNSTTFQVVFATGYMTVSSVGTNTFAVPGTPFALHAGDVIAHYGRGIPFSNNTGGPASVYIAPNLPPPSVGTTITVPGPVYPLYNDGGRNYAMQVLALGQPFIVTTNSDSGPDSLRQEVLNSAALADTNAITFAANLAAQTIVLTNGQIVLSNNVTIDASALPGGMQISGNGQSRIFQVNGGQTILLRNLILSGGNGAGAVSDGYGGAVLNNGTLTVNGCTFTGNQANNAFGGGGIFNYGTLTMNNCTFTGNQANNDIGGSAIVQYGTMTANNCSFFGNQATNDNGAVIYNGDTTTAINCTFFGNLGNSAAYGGGIYVYGTFNLTNCIVCSNSAPNIYRNLVFGTLNSDANSLVNGNPMLAPPGNYGGPTPTMPPLPGSAATDTGNDYVTNFLATDQRGSARKVGAHVDLGAVESGGLWVTNNTDSGPGALRTVLALATNVPSPKTILFTTNLSGAVILLASQLLVTDTKGVTVNASSLPGGILISGNATTRVFFVTNGALATLNSLTIAYGLAPGGDFTSGGGDGGVNDGAGIRCQGRLALLNCSVVNNLTLAPYLGNGYAGGILCNGGYVALTNCTVAGNEVFGQYGEVGAFYNFDGTLILDHCTVANNLASSYNGGVAQGGSTILHATVLANGNTDFGNIGGGISLGDNFIADGTSSGLVNGVNGDQVGTAANPLNASLAVLANYGGPTPTMPPLPGSPLVDAGGPPDIATDQRGYPRLLGLAPDIGAVEGIYTTAGPGTLAGAKRLSDGSIQFSFTNLTDRAFSVLAGTNLTQSLSTWMPLGPAVESPAGSGQFQFSDPHASQNYPNRFYRVESRQ